MAGQLITVRLNRGDASSPWGFRLQGGKDWGTPLAVSKINPGSLAEQGGLQVGDFIIKIGNQSAQDLLHHEAQEAIKNSKNNLDLQVQRGGTITWRPSVTPVGELPKPGTVSSPVPVTKTSLARTTPESKPIGSGHNVAPKPFAGNNRALVHKQFNSPLNLYSMNNIKETLQAHTEQLAPGVMGINFMKPDAPVNTHSAVYQAILEEEQSKKGDYYQRQPSINEPSLRPVSPSIQSTAFRRLQSALESGEDVKPGTIGTPNPVSPTPHSPRGPGLFPSSSVTKHVDPPTSRPGSGKPQDPSLNTCGQCGGLITGVFCRIRDKNLHGECFKCATCGTSLKNVGYFNVNEKLYCDTHAGQAAQHLANATGSSLEPVAIRPGASIPKDANIAGIGSMPCNSSPTPGKISSPRIMIPSPTHGLGGFADRPTSPSVMGAVPWHQQSPGSMHHVDAPQSPRLLQTTTPLMTPVNSVPAPPVAPKPQYKPMGSQSPSLYQSHPHPYTGPVGDTHKDISGGSKFTWPPPKPSTPIGTPDIPSSNSTMAPSLTPSQVPTFRPVVPSGGQRINAYEPAKISTNASNYQ